MNEENLNTINKRIVDIKVIGVGGSGNNTVHSMIREGIEGVDFIVANTDEQVLASSPSDIKIKLGKSVSDGLGAGANPEIGLKAAEESKDDIIKAIGKANLVIIAAGMGGGTGTGAAPYIAKLAKDMGILTVAVVTTPFEFEGTTRSKNAKNGLNQMKKSVDSFIVVSNEKLIDQYGDAPITDSFMYADMTLKQTIRTITDLISVPSMINLDFADVTTVMKDKGASLVGIGRARGEDRAIKAATYAISSPILEAKIDGAKHALINISGGKDIKLNEARNAVATIKKLTSDDINIIFGIAINENNGSDLVVSVIATGVDPEFKPSTEEEYNKEISSKLEEIKEDVVVIDKESDFEFDDTEEIDFETEEIDTIEVKSNNTIEMLVENPENSEDDNAISFETELRNNPLTSEETIEEEIESQEHNLVNSPLTEEISEKDEDDLLPDFLR